MKNAGIRWRSAAGAVLVILILPPAAPATPPEYLSFHRVQQIDPQIREEDVLRIWAVYVGQGDSFLIQLPSRFDYTLDGRPERIEILVDGGPGLTLRAFMGSLYPSSANRIEYAVLTHHDKDHVAGLTKLLAGDRFGIERIYHNGLASWKLQPPRFPEPSSAESTMQSTYLIDGLDALKAAVEGRQLVGPYDDFAKAIVNETAPFAVTGFPRAHTGGSFIGAAGGPSLGAEIALDVIWPRDPGQRYGGWSESINGNSVTFKLTYGEFSMLFTGDHNEKSEVDLLDVVPNAAAVLKSDVLKVPHHGSKHNERAFFEAVDPVVAVASMGKRGFGQWQHPSTDVIRWLGGSHRVYHTYLHERRFKYEHLTDDDARAVMVELRNVLIETDGTWFRVVEVENPNEIKNVRQVGRGNGTRWIRSRE